MNKLRVVSNLAISMTWALVAFGLLLEIYAIPVVSQELASTYVEYSGERMTIQLLLSGLVVAGQASLVVIALLLSRIKDRALLEKSSANLAFILATTFLGVAALLFGLMQWLVMKNTLPPAIAIFLVVSILLSAIASLVTFSLTEVLKEATRARVELERVI